MDIIFEQDNELFLPHFSPSTVNSFITSRYSFYKSKVERTPFTGNQYTARGTAVEHGVNVWIENPALDPLIAAMGKFDEELQKSSVSRATAKEVQDSIPGLLDLALGFYKKEFSHHQAVTQTKVEVKLDGVSRTMLGYLDFIQNGFAVRDCKVTSKTPSYLSQSYILQGAMYQLATGLPVFFDFFVPNKKPSHKAIMLTEQQFKFGISYLTRACQVLEELNKCSNPKRIIYLMSFPDLSSLYSLEDKKAAAKAWGIEY